MDERASLIERLAAVADRFDRAARTADPVPVAGEWSQSDVVRHLIAVEREVWQPRIAQLAAEDQPHWPWVEPDRWTGDPEASLGQLIETYRVTRATTIAALDGIAWSKTGSHATFGTLDVAGLMTKAIDHDDEHVAGLTR